MDRIFTAAANAIAGFVGNPVAFVLAFGTIVVWAVTGPLFHYSDTWQLVINTGTTIITFLIVFLIQNSQNRDAAAMQAKLDEVIRSLDGARNAFIGIEHLTEHQLRAILVAVEQETDANEADRETRRAAVARLLQRT